MHIFEVALFFKLLSRYYEDLRDCMPKDQTDVEEDNAARSVKTRDKT